MTLAIAKKQAPDSTSKAKRDGARGAPTNSSQGRGSFPVPFMQRKPTCACGGGCPRCKEHSVQEGPEIGQLQDGYEREADHVAEQMIRMPEPQLQRACSCGNHTMAGGECSECRKKDRLGLQTQLKVNEPGDIYEREADRVADQVMATPAHPGVSGVPPRIQRTSGQSNGQMDAAPASVGQAIASPGRPLEPATRALFEPRFGHDFGHVRVHAGPPADEAARAIHAHAFTAGHHVVFAAGRYAPQTPPGRSLLAHELTHVVQQSGAGPSTPIQRQAAFGGENLAARANISPEKWSEQIEQEYWKRDDFERANAVRACRLQGPPACKWLLTISEVHACYARGINAENCQASGGGGTKVEPVAAGVEPVAAGVEPVAAGTAAALKYPPPAPAPPAAPPPRPTHLPGRHGPVRFPAPPSPPALAPPTPAAPPGHGSVRFPATGPARAAIARISALTGPAAIGTVIVVSGIQLHLFGTYQEKLRALGYIILEDPLKICTGGCHLPSRPRPPSFPDLGPSMLRPPPPILFDPRIGPLSPDPDLVDWLEPSPTPRPDPSERGRRRRKRKGCSIKPTFPRGGNKEHDALAAFVTGQPVEYLVSTPEGDSKRYDGMDETETLYDVKTLHDWLAVLGNPQSRLTFGGALNVARGVTELRLETIRERDIAERCDYSFHLATNNLQVVQHMREVLGDIMNPDEIEYVADFTWP